MPAPRRNKKSSSFKRKSIAQRIMTTVEILLVISFVVMTAIVHFIYSPTLQFTVLFAVLFSIFSVVLSVVLRLAVAKHINYALGRLAKANNAFPTTGIPKFTARIEDLDEPQDEVSEIYANFSELSENIEQLVSEINRVEHEMYKNHLDARGDTSQLKGATATALSNFNRVLDTVFDIVYNAPAVIAVFDTEAKFIYTNKLCREKGFYPNVYGKTIHEVSPSDETRRIRDAALDVIRIGADKYTQLPRTSSTGVELVEEYKFSPLKNKNGDVVASILVITTRQQR